MSTNDRGIEHLVNAIEAIQAKIILSAIVCKINVKGADYMTSVRMDGESTTTGSADLEFSHKSSSEQNGCLKSSNVFRGKRKGDDKNQEIYCFYQNGCIRLK